MHPKTQVGYPLPQPRRPRPHSFEQSRETVKPEIAMVLSSPLELCLKALSLLLAPTLQALVRHWQEEQAGELQKELLCWMGRRPVLSRG